MGKAEAFKLVQYNMLTISGTMDTWTYVRLPYIETVLNALNPDVLVAQEIMDEEGAQLILDILQDMDPDYEMADFIDGPDTDNMLFYRSSLFTLTGQSVVETELRDIGEYVIETCGNTMYIFSAHLKASSGWSNMMQRSREAQELRDRLELFPDGTDYIVCGDMNFYGISEPAWDVFTESGDGQLLDPIDTPAEWHENEYYAWIHTQSPRTTDFWGGSTGGMDDRFDFIFLSPTLMDGADVDYIDDSYEVYGNDGRHFNLAISSYPTIPEGATIAEGLHSASDHLPVVCLIDAPALSIKETAQEQSHFAIYPNPFNSVCSISGATGNVSIFDVSGKLIARQDGNTRWNPSNSLPSGIYTFTDEAGQSLRAVLVR